LALVAEALVELQHYDMRAIFRHCGWFVPGAFDPTANYEPAIRVM
jgi:hypothetical protein